MDDYLICCIMNAIGYFYKKREQEVAPPTIFESSKFALGLKQHKTACLSSPIYGNFSIMYIPNVWFEVSFVVFDTERRVRPSEKMTEELYEIFEVLRIDETRWRKNQ